MFLKKRADNANNTVQLPPPPYVLEPSGSFDGNDGKWSTFYINLGDDGSGGGQNFKVLISTSMAITLVPAQSETCNKDCAASRGVQVFNGDQPLGFNQQASKAWKTAGLYSIPLPEWWSWGGFNGTWGSENIGLGESSTKSPILADQWAVEYTFDELYMGSFGLAVGSVNAGGAVKDPFLANFVAFNQTPSSSYGYTAGAYYRNNNKGTVGNLVFGGYDASRAKVASGVSISMPSKQNNTLSVGVQSILYKPDQDTEANTFSFTTEGFPATIDSTLPYLWLPNDICDKFAERFQLTYNEKENLYFVNASAHQNNQQRNATVSFKIVPGDRESTEFATIELPYDAFDLQIGTPIVDNATNYFPLKKSPNGMYVLGRTFLQEAYIIVDYERANFTVAPAIYADPMPGQQLVPIYKPGFELPTQSSPPQSSGSSGIGGGAIAGIVVGVVGGLLVAALIAFFFWKRKRTAAKELEEKTAASEIDTVVAGNEVKHRRVSELDSEPPNSPKPSTLGGYYGDREQKDVVPFPPINEMESPPAELYSPPAVDSTPNSEVNGSDYFIVGNRVRRRGATRESSGNNTPGTPIAELPGDEGRFQHSATPLDSIANPKGLAIQRAHSRGPSDSSVHTNIDEVVARPDPSPSRKEKAEGDKDGAMEEAPKAEGGEAPSAAEPTANLERRPSHARGLSDTTVASESTAVSQPTPEELEAWANGGDEGPRRPLSQ